MEEMIKNPYALFAENQETYEEAVKKSTDESQSFQRTKHFRMDSAGTYTVTRATWYSFPPGRRCRP